MFYTFFLILLLGTIQPEVEFTIFIKLFFGLSAFLVIAKVYVKF